MTIGPKGKRVQFILLDTRYFRSPLKRRQKRKGQGSLWAERIGSGRNSRRNPMEVVGENFAPNQPKSASSHPVFKLSQPLTAGKPGNFPKERKRFLDLLSKTKANGVIILSGDRHSSEISKLSGHLPYPFRRYLERHESEAEAPSRRNPHRLGERYFDENFGLLKINWTGSKPQVAIEVRDLKGEVVRKAEVAFQ